MSAIITINNQVDSAIGLLEKILTSDDDFWFFTGRSIKWDDEFSPPVASPSLKAINETNKLKLYMRRIKEENCLLAIRKTIWKSGVIYTQYTTDQIFFDYRTWDNPDSSFYVVNSEGNIYKCISNNYNTVSIQEPTGTNLDYIFTSDGYMWKFMFSLSTTISDTFPSDMWTPVPHRESDKSSIQIDVENASVSGDIAFIRMDNKGSKYSGTPNVIINGDGTGCTGTAIVENGEIVKIIITNYGSGYNYADVTITGTGTGAIATAMVSPIYGHGSDAKYELGAYYTLFNFFLIDDEDGDYPVFNTYRNIGIVKNVRDKSGNPIVPVNSNDSFNSISTLHIINSTGTFNQNEVVMGDTSLAKGIVYFDPTGTDKDVSIYAIEGEFQDGEYIYGQQTSVNGEYIESLSDINNININSGIILYTENIIFITRREIQTERFIFTIEF